MADTIITPATRDYDSAANALGWAVAVILLLGVILFGMFVWPGINRSVAPSTPTNQGIDVNVKIPEGVIPGTNSGGTTNTSGGAQQPNASGGAQTQ